MTDFLAWYLAIILLGWLAFPLAYRLFPALADRGYSLARTLGLLLWGYFFWLSSSLGLAQNDSGGVLFGLLLLGGLSAWAILTTIENRKSENRKSKNHKSEIANWLRVNTSPIFTVEALFLAAFAFLALVRAASPEIIGTEKPMELAFINAILRSPVFPPHDPWLSGYAISYYYFGYVMTAMLAKLTGVPGSVAFNLMISLVFALSAAGAYGIVYNMLAARRVPSDPRLPVHNSRLTALPLLGPLFLLLVSNLEGFLEVLHRRGVFWRFDADGAATSSFWTWLDMKELSQPPAQPLGWIPERFWWWWRASRVVQDYDLAGNFREVIDEFPFFSYLLADLHPHVLAMPFALLAIGLALNLFLGGWKGVTDLFIVRLEIRPAGFLLAALTLGGLAFLNTWDILVGAALIVAAYVMVRVREAGWGWERFEDAIALGLPLGALAFLLYLPFYLGFSSQAGGLLPNLISPTRGAHLWVMFAPLLLPIFAYLLYLLASERIPANWPLGVGVAVGVPLLLWGLSWLLAWVIGAVDPELARNFLTAQGMPDVRTLFEEAGLRRLSYVGGLLTLLALLAPTLAFLAKAEGRTSTPRPSTFNLQPSTFTLLLLLLGGLLVLAPEFVYLRDQFGTRMNTVFKFYYQAWLLWSLAAACGTALLLRELRRLWLSAFALGLSLLTILALTYPLLGLLNRTNGFDPPSGWTLDGAAHIARADPDEAAAIRWLQGAPPGVAAEAASPGGSYTDYARISTHSGLPTVLGWPGHEAQWRGGYQPQGTRLSDIETLYTAADWVSTLQILRQYDIRYVYVGNLERSTYAVQDEKFRLFLRLVFQQGNVVIYEVPPETVE